jgi:hypothetical protein
MDGEGPHIENLLEDFVMLNIRGVKLTVGKELLRKVKGSKLEQTFSE